MLPLLLAPLLAKRNQQSDSAGSGKMAKSIGIALGVGVVGFVGWRVYKNYKDKKEERERTKTVEKFGKLADKRNLSFTESEFDMMVNYLLTAMRGAGTDELTVVDVLTNPKFNRDDIIYIIHKFGVQDYKGNPLTLIEWVKEEMTESERFPIEQLFAQYNIL